MGETLMLEAGSRALAGCARTAIAVGAAALALAAGAAAEAATPTWADPAGLCNGETPCFTTLAAAVSNAGPPPAEVFVFPGTYAESVDLDTMGSAIGGAPGALAVVSVDAAGQPAPGAVVDPGAPGGPLTGPAIGATGFPGALTIDGLVVRSPDADAIALAGGTAAVLLARLDASNAAAGSGVAVANAAGTLRVEDSLAVLNAGSGFALASPAGAVEIADSTAERNDESGFNVRAPAVSVLSSVANANGEHGFELLPAGTPTTLVALDLQANFNDVLGVVAIDLMAGPQFATAAVGGVEAITNQIGGMVFAAAQLTAASLTARGNGGVGVVLAGGTVTAGMVLAENNTGLGVGVSIFPGVAGSSWSLSDVTSTGNRQGVEAGDETDPTTFPTGTLSNVTASSKLEVGVFALAGALTATAVTAEGNGSVGAVLAPGASLAATAVVSNANDGIGILVFGPTLPDVQLADCHAGGNVTGIAVIGRSVVVENCTATASGPSMGGPPRASAS